MRTNNDTLDAVKAAAILFKYCVNGKCDDCIFNVKNSHEKYPDPKCAINYPYNYSEITKGG